MADAIYKEYELYCPVCQVTFKQLVVLHKVPKDFRIDDYLAGMVEQHDHKAFKDAMAQSDRSMRGDKESD
jgi:hypothetical protein